MSLASDINPRVRFCYPAATLYLRELVSGLVEWVSLPLLLVITIAGFVLYSGAVGATVGNLTVFYGYPGCGRGLWDQRAGLSADCRSDFPAAVPCA